MKIVAGSYKSNGFGIYLGPCGKTRCKIRVDGDTKPHRNLWRTSIAPMVEENEVPTGDVVVKRADYERLLSDVSTLTTAMKELEIKVKKFDSTKN